MYIHRKIVVCGPRGAGKTSLAQYLAFGTCFVTEKSTEVDILTRCLTFDSRNYRLQIWDLGSIHYKSQYRAAHCVVLVLDGSKKEVDHKYKIYVKTIRKFNTTVPIVTLINKSDLRGYSDLHHQHISLKKRWNLDSLLAKILRPRPTKYLCPCTIS